MNDFLREALEKRGRKWGEINDQQIAEARQSSPTHPAERPHSPLISHGEGFFEMHRSGFVTQIPGAE